MRNFFFSALLIFISFNANASLSGIFEIDYEKIHQSLSEIGQVEEYLLVNPGVSHAELAQLEPELADKVESQAKLGYTSATTEGPIGIPSFLWGCVLGVIGILIVYLVSRDSAETTSALWGCIVGLVFWTIIGFSFDLFSGLF